MPDAAKEAALAAANDLFQSEEEEQPVEAEAETSEQPEGSAVEQSLEDDSQHEAEEAEELPEDIEALLTEPDYEEEAEEEVAAEEEADEEEEWDDEKRELRKKLLAAEKKAEFYENQRAQSERKNWVKEVNKHFPYADAEAIKATSRRGFLRAAKAEHEGIKARVDTALESRRSQLEAEREQIRAEERKRLEEAWGKPTTGPGVAPARAAEASESVDEAFRTRGLAAGIKEWMREGGD